MQVVVGVVMAILTADVIIGVAAGAGFIAVANPMVRLWTRHTGPPVAHRRDPKIISSRAPAKKAGPAATS